MPINNFKNFERKGKILFLIIILLLFAACSSGVGTTKSAKDPTENIPTPEATRIICFQLNEDRSEIAGYYGVDDNGKPCPRDVVIPTGIFAIGNSAFNNKFLTSVFFPQNLVIIEDNAFANNSLTSVTIPDSVTSIGTNAFSGNSFSSYIYIPNENAIVNATAFDSNVTVAIEGSDSCFESSNNALSEYYCLGQEITIPNEVISINNRVFENKGLTSVSFPQSVTEIGANAFSGNSFSSYIYIPNENAIVNATAFDSNVTVAIESSDSCFESSNNALSEYYCLRQEITIPNGIISINNRVFENKGLTSVSFPQSVTEIGANAFSGNSFSSYIYIPNENAIVNATAFDSNVTVAIEGSDSCFEISNNALSEYYCMSRDVTVLDGVTSIEANAFENKGLNSVTFPQTLIGIGNSAFKNNSLTSLTIPDNVVTIGANAFSGNVFSSYIYIPNENATVDATAFNSNVIVAIEGTDSCFEITNNALSNYYCMGRDIVIPDGVTNIAASVFENKGLTSVSFPQTLTDIGDNAFKNNSLTSLTIGDSVVTLGANAFSGNVFSSYIYIPNGNATVDATAFNSSVIVAIEGTDSCFEITNNALSNYYCMGRDIVIPDGVTNIAASVFENKGLTSVSFPQTLTDIGDNAFKNNSLTSLTIGDSVVTIGANAFSGNVFSSYIYIPNENATVDATAFNSSVIVAIEGTGSCFEISNNVLSDYYCLGRDVTVPDGVITIAENAFKDKGLTSVTFPESVEDIGANAFSGNTFSSLVYIPNEDATVNAAAFDQSVDVAIGGTGSCFEISNNVLSDYYCLGRDVTVPDGVITIAENAFKDKGLTSVTFPESVEDIGANAFSGNTFSSLVYIPNEDATVNAAAFDQSVDVAIGGTGSCFEISNNVLSDYYCLGRDVTVPDGVITIAENAFKDKGLTSVTFPESVEDIGANAFSGNTFSSLVYIPNEDATVNDMAFDSGVIVAIEGTDSCFEISSNALSNYYCMAQEVTIPNGVTSIEDGAFEDKGLTSVTFPSALESIGNDAFKDNDLMDLTLPATITDIGDNAFDGNSNLGQVYIPNSNASVGTNTFPNDDYVLAGVTACFEFDSSDTNQINDYYDNEGDNSNFPACSRDVEIPQGVTAIGDNAFKNKSLTSVVIPNSVTSIGTDAFRNNSLISVIIPDSVTSVGTWSFYTNSLTSVTLGSGFDFSF